MPICFSVLPKYYKSVPELNQYKARDGETLSYRCYENSHSKKAILLLHGSSAHGEYLDPLAKRLSQIGTVVVPNLRGHYGSGKTKGDCSYVGQLEDDLADLIEHCSLRGREIFVAGHSSGGGLAIRLANGLYGKWFKGFILFSPAIPTAPTMRQGTAGGWANVSIGKIIGLSILNQLGIRYFNHVKVIEFNRPKEFCDGTETLSYSFNLNSSYHPRVPYDKDIEAVKNRSLVIIGTEDEANDPTKYPEVMQDLCSKSIKLIPGARHLDIAHHAQAAEAAIHWMETF